MTAHRPGGVEGIHALTEKEKQALRLMVRGHDAKSLARHLGLSVHTVNERLRDARRKLAVSSSREAARRLLDTERCDPEIHADELFGDAASGLERERRGSGPSRRGATPSTGLVAGALIMIAILAFAALSALPPAGAPQGTAAAAPSAATAADTEAVRAARMFLELHDQARWADSYAATGSSFQKSNTLKTWADVATQARTPLGATESRVLISEDSVPTPPAGAQIIKFRTNFVNRKNVVETVSLAREGGEWKVSGIYLDW